MGAAPLAAGVEAEAEEGGSRSKFDTSNLLAIALTLFLGSRIFPLSDLKLTALFRFTGGLLASAFKTTFFIVQCNYMEDLKLLLIDRLKSKGVDPSLIPAFLKALTSLISSEPRLEPAQINQKLHSLG